MYNAVAELCAELSSAATPNELHSVMSALTERLGFKYFCCALLLSAPVLRCAPRLVSNCPGVWPRRYLSSRGVPLDPLVRVAMHTQTPVFWSDAIFGEAPQLWRDAQKAGLKYGVSQSSWSAQGALVVMSLARDSAPLDHNDKANLSVMLAWLSSTVHVSMRRLYGGELGLETLPPLTAREQEVILLSGEGKTAPEISQILGISLSTVNFHMNNVLVKLSATNKVQAVVKAFMLGLITA